MAIPLTTISGILASCLLALALQLFFLSPSPLMLGTHFGALEMPSPSSTLSFPSNSKLQEVVKLGEGLLKHPEAVAVDGTGTMYTATRDGWIKRLRSGGLGNGTWENWWHVESDGLLGMAATEAGDLILCDADKGLIKAGVEGVIDLVTHVNGNKIRFSDDVAAASSDGMVYFSIASTKFDLNQWYLDMLEPISSGQLVQFDPATGTATVLLDHLGFANGIALSQNQDYVVVCETWKYRCLKHVLKGENKGKTETFIEHLPGGPDNINLAPDGSFWIALLQITPSRWLRFVPKLVIGEKVLEWSNGIRKKATVINVGSDGKFIRGFDDPTGKVMAFVTSALEYEGNLYLGSLQTDFVGKLPLN